MKRFLVVDNYGGGYKNSMHLNDLKQLLIDEVEEDTIRCYEDSNIEGIKYNIKLLKNMINNTLGTKEIIEELSNYGWFVQDLCELQEQLSNYQAYKHGVGAPSYPNDCIEETLKMIEEDMK